MVSPQSGALTMHNPSYLTLSRHNIYYFRWPLVDHNTRPKQATQIKISLRTRDPKEALQLSRTLEYHARELTQSQELLYMKHADIVSILRSHFSEVLERQKERIKNDGVLSDKRISNIKLGLEDVNAAIADSRDELYDYAFCKGDMPEELSINVNLEPIMERFKIKCKEGSHDHDMLREEYKFALRNYYQDLLEYNKGIRNYTHLTAATATTASSMNYKKPENRLENIIEKYLTDMKRSGEWSARSEEGQLASFALLTEFLGGQFDILKLDGKTARNIKDVLLKLPNNRNNIKATRGLPLLEQIEIKGLKTLATGSINKYLQAYQSLCKWAVQNNYITSNPFEGMMLKNKKKDKRNKFDKLEIASMLTEIDRGKDGLAKTEFKYWGALIAIYTGARLNEIASLTVDDIKQNADTGIWYFDINDEDGKRVKTDAAIRFVPIHSALLDRGFIEYVDTVRKMRDSTDRHDLRLLHELTYCNGSQWGRKLGRWFNNTFLPKMNLKTDKKVLHSLRHSFITYMSAHGAESSTIKALVGHEAGTVTEGVYTDYGLDHLPAFKDAIEKLEY